ncbi:MAG: hypothetical protein ACQEVA_14895 [Myxococcota bacterium]
MITGSRILPVLGMLLVAACQSAPPEQAQGDPTYPKSEDDARAYPEDGPPLRECEQVEASSGEICRLTPVDDREVRVRVRFPDSTSIDSTAPVPADLIRFRFLGRLEDFAACVIPAARQGWTGRAETAIEATLVGATFEHVTMAPAGLPEETTACFQELTRRLRVTRAPGEDARITQPTTILVERTTPRGE